MSFFSNNNAKIKAKDVEKRREDKGKSLKRKKDDGWGGEGWGSYMKEKERKLQEQFHDLNKNKTQSPIAKPRIFNGVCIFVNGYTNPSSDHLKQIMAENGGLFQHYYSKRTCTHIIATNLPDSKIKELKNEKVVHPNWILDSLKYGKCLPYEKYLLYKTTHVKQAQAFLKSIGSSLNAKDKVKQNASRSDNSDLRAQKEAPEITKTHNLLNDNADLDNHLDDDDDDDDDSQIRFREHRDSLGTTSHIPEGISDGHSEPRVSILEKEALISDVTAPMLSKHDYSTNTHSKPCSKAGDPELISDVTAPMLSKHDYTTNTHSKPCSKAGDPGFMNDFYSNSRLHHLSMWRSELKRFASMIASSANSKRKRRNDQSQRCIMHVDMDSFFVSVTLKERPDLRGKPVAVCHASKGTNTSGVSSMSEIASCSYEARSKGVRNGMFLGQAKKLCPELICVPYKFESYRVVSQQFYEVLASFTSDIEAVSCDEALLDISDLVTEDFSALDLASRIRESIFASTGCKASAGIASNILLARMATRKAKPNGQFHLKRDEVKDFLGRQPVTDLPGVGRSLEYKLNEMGVTTCSDLRSVNLSKLQEKFGPKTGLTLHKHCRGLDDRPIKTDHERQSVSAEINYGIRFVEEHEAVSFIKELSKEVHDRLKAIQMKGTHIALKVMVRRKEAPEPQKHMGHGICDNISKSSSMLISTDDMNVIAKECKALLKSLKISASDIRGMGIQVSKLVKADSECKGVKTIDFSNARPAQVSYHTETAAAKWEEGPLSNFVDQCLNKSSKVEHCLNQSYSLAHESHRSSSVDHSSKQSELIGRDSHQSISVDHSNRTAFLDNGSSHTINSRVLKGRVNKGNMYKCRNGKKPSPRKTDKPKIKSNHLRIDSFMKSTTVKDSTALFDTIKDDTSDPPLPSLFSSPERLKVTTRSVEFDLPSPSQIDPSVFSALPEDVQRSIRESYRAKHQDFNVVSDPEQDVGLGDKCPLVDGWKEQTDSMSYYSNRVANESNKNAIIHSEHHQPMVGSPRMDYNDISEVTCRVKSEGKSETTLSDELSLSQIDPEVMKELPDELRKEILQNIRFEQRRKKREEQKRQIMNTGSPEKKTRQSYIDVNNQRNSGAKQMMNTGSPEKRTRQSHVNVNEQRHGGFQAFGTNNAEDCATAKESVEESDQNCADQRETDEKETKLHHPQLCGKSDYKDLKQLIKCWIQSSDDPLIEDIEAVSTYIEDLISVRNMEQAFLLIKYIQRLAKTSQVWRNVSQAIQFRVQELMQGMYGGKLLITET